MLVEKRAILFVGLMTLKYHHAHEEYDQIALFLEELFYLAISGAASWRHGVNVSEWLHDKPDGMHTLIEVMKHFILMLLEVSIRIQIHLSLLKNIL